MTAARVPQRRQDRRGFTLIEVMLSLLVGVMVLGAVFQLMILQGRAYGKQREIMDARDTRRGGAALLAWELRHARVAGTPLRRMTADSVAFRSVQGLGVICAKHATLARYALWRTGGSIQATADDTALVYTAPKEEWRNLKITQVGTPAALGVPTCAGVGAPAPDLAVELAVSSKWDTINIMRGAPLRSYRRIAYAEYQANGRWWLGRKVGAAGTYEQLTGPLLPPASGGLAFAYYDAAGAVTADPALVATVQFTLRSQSDKQSALRAGPMQFQQDSVTTKVALTR